MMFYENYAKKNSSYFICNDIIKADDLWNDGIHLEDVDTNILSSNFCKFLNRVLFNLKIDIFRQSPLNQRRNEFDSNLDGLQSLRKICNTDPMISHLNINYLINKINSHREVIQKVEAATRGVLSKRCS